LISKHGFLFGMPGVIACLSPGTEETNGASFREHTAKRGMGAPRLTERVGTQLPLSLTLLDYCALRY
jgi:hypothetical protein